MAGAVTTTKMICEVHNITEGSLEIGLDGNSAMKAVFAVKDPKPEDPCCGMILDVRRTLQELTIKVTGRHIEGHQDKRLDRWAKLNIQMDASAKDLLRKRIAQGFISQPAPLGNETLQIYFRGNKLSGEQEKVVRDHLWGETPLAVTKEAQFDTGPCGKDQLDSHWESTPG